MLLAGRDQSRQRPARGRRDLRPRRPARRRGGMAAQINEAIARPGSRDGEARQADRPGTGDHRCELTVLNALKDAHCQRKCYAFGSMPLIDPGRLNRLKSGGGSASRRPMRGPDGGAGLDHAPRRGGGADRTPRPGCHGSVAPLDDTSPTRTRIPDRSSSTTPVPLRPSGGGCTSACRRCGRSGAAGPLHRCGFADRRLLGLERFRFAAEAQVMAAARSGDTRRPRDLRGALNASFRRGVQCASLGQSLRAIHSDTGLELTCRLVAGLATICSIAGRSLFSARRMMPPCARLSPPGSALAAWTASPRSASAPSASCSSPMRLNS